MKLALLGYGKMGREIEQVALQRNHQVVLKVDAHNADIFTKDELREADTAIEFSTPATAVPNILKCFEAGIPVVVGTTGWMDKLEEVTKKCREKNQTLFHASNFSIGVNIFFKVNEYLANIMNRHPEYAVSLEETHHIHKLDSPSGTALHLAQGIFQQMSRKTKWVNQPTEKAEELPIFSKREAEVPGTHIVQYSSAVDEIKIAHIAHSRKGFAFGAVLAAEWIAGKKGVYTMKDLLQL